MKNEPKKCAHSACNCIVEEGKKFCSDHCHDTHKMLELTCQCHHAGCQGESLHR